MENEKDLREQIAQLQQQVTELKAAATPQPKPKKDYFVLKLIGYILGFFALVIGGWFAWVCWWPLDNDDEVKQASIQAHDALQDLRDYSMFHGEVTNLKCDGGCPVCHPTTWRYHVRQVRGEVP